MQPPVHPPPATHWALSVETAGGCADRAQPRREACAATPSLALRSIMSAVQATCQPAWAWAVTLLVVAIDACWLAFGEWTLAPSSVAATGGAFAAFLAPLCLDRYRGDARIGSTLRAGALLVLFTAAAGILSYLVVSTNASLVDAQLAAWDHGIGFDWVGVFQWMQAHPALQASLRLAYISGLPQMAFVLVFLGFTARTAQLDEFLGLYFAAVLVVVALSWPFPAAGPWAHYSLSAMLDASSMSHFALLREGSLRTLDLEQMQGLIAIPSLHTALAIILVYAMRATRLLPVFVLLNGWMIVATPIEGGHYVVDVLAGAVLAVLLIAISRLRAARAFGRLPS